MKPGNPFPDLGLFVLLLFLFLLLGANPAFAAIFFSVASYLATSKKDFHCYPGYF